MNKTIAYCSIACFVAVVVCLSSFSPFILSDSNSFLKDFVNHEFLNILGVILAITLASAAQLHLTFNQIEEKYKDRGMDKSRAGVKTAASWLVGLFCISTVLVVLKPLLPSDEWCTSLINGAALLIVWWNILVLISLTRAVFAIQPNLPSD